MVKQINIGPRTIILESPSRVIEAAGRSFWMQARLIDTVRGILTEAAFTDDYGELVEKFVENASLRELCKKFVNQVEAEMLECYDQINQD